MRVESLIEAIKLATVRLEVVVPSRCYYARSGDYDTEYIYYVDSDRLVQALEAVKEEGDA